MAFANCGSPAQEVQDAVFDIDLEIENVAGSEAGFYTKDKFKAVVRKFLDDHAETRRRRTFCFRSDYDLAVRILQNKNTTLGSAKNRNWVRSTFELKELGTLQYPVPQLVKKRSKLPVCPYDHIYDVLCKLHDGIHKHVGQKAMWDLV